jgi:hypothetical protein
LRGVDAAACPHCGRPLTDADGDELRALDLRYESIEAAQSERYRMMCLAGTPAVVLLSLGLPLLHAGAVLVVPILAIAHLVVVRLYLIRDAVRLLGPARRRFVRWFCRFGFLWLGLPGYALATVPMAGAIPAAATFLALTTAIHRYVAWSLERERLREPLLGWEKLLLTVLAVITVMLVVVLVLIGALVGWSLAALIDWLGAG